MKIKLFFIGLFILVFGLLIIPQFTLNINGSEFKYPNINLGLINPNSNLGEFKKGAGIYNSKEYSALVDFSSENFLSVQEKKETFKNLLAIIQKRVEYSSLSDIETTGQIIDNQYYIKFTIPQYYSDQETLVQLLTSKGEVSFLNDPQVSSSTVDLTDKDIKGLVNVSYDENYGNVLEFKFNESKANELTLAVANTQRYFLMSVDGIYWAVTDNVYTPLVVKAIPFTNALSSTSVLGYANIVRSYFLSDPLDHSITFDTTKTKEITRDYIQDSVTFLSFVFILSAVGLSLFFYISYGLNKTVKFMLMLSSFIVFFVFLLKIQGAVTSINMLTGFLIAYLLAAVVIWSLIKSPVDELDTNLVKFRNLSISLLFVVIGLYKLVPNLDNLIDLYGGITSGLLSLLLMTVLNFKYITNLELNINLRKIFKR